MKKKFFFFSFNYERTIFTQFYCLLSFLYLVVFFLKKLYVFKVKPKAHTIIVGNINVGGTGKTPLIIELIKNFKEKNIKVGVISKGYGRKSKKNIFVENYHSADVVGDEPLLIKRKTDVKVLVGNSRNKLIQIFEEESNLQVLFLMTDYKIIVFTIQYSNVRWRKIIWKSFLIQLDLRELVLGLKYYDFLICKKSTKSAVIFHILTTMLDLFKVCN